MVWDIGLKSGEKLPLKVICKVKYSVKSTMFKKQRKIYFEMQDFSPHVYIYFDCIAYNLKRLSILYWRFKEKWNKEFFLSLNYINI